MSYSSSTKQYKGSPNSYFRQLPDLDYPSLRNDRNSVYDYHVVKNIFKRAVLRDDVFDELQHSQNILYKVMRDQTKLHINFTMTLDLIGLF